MVDEAHSTGVFGKKGGGLIEHLGLSGKIDIVMGTLSKALGSVGGYLAGSGLLKKYLTNRSRHFIYTTAPAPSASAAAMASIEIILKEPELRERLWDNINFLRKGLKEIGFDLMGSVGPIIPIRIGETKKCLRLKDFLKTNGVFVSAIRPPTVPKKTDRLRISVTAAHRKEDLEKLLEVLKMAEKKGL